MVRSPQPPTATRGDAARRRVLIAMAIITAPALLFALLLNAREPVAAQTTLRTTVCQVQGTGGPSPLLDTVAVVTGIVSADLIETSTGGFFLEHPGCDEDAQTSNGILVFTFSETDVEVAVGQTVVVTGTVEEYFGMTQLRVDRTAGLGVELLSEGAAPSPTLLDPPAAVADALVYLEAHEGMVVELPPARVVGATNHFGEPYVVPAEGGPDRVWRGEEDGRRLGLLFPRGWQVLDHGDIVTGAVGGLNYTYGNYKLSVSADVQISAAGLQPPHAEPSGADELTIASYNVENLFDTVNTPGKEDGGNTPSEEDYPLELARRAGSIRDYLGAPDVLCLQEVESELVIADLAAQELLADVGYDSRLIEGPDVRGIDVGFLFKRDVLRLVEARDGQKCQAEKPWSGGPDEECTMPDGGSGWMLYSRPPLVARFELVGRDAQLTMICNHFKSKGGGEMETTPERTAMARHTLDLLAAEKALRPDVPVLVLGDLNEFPDREPIETLVADGRLVSMYDRLEDRQYSYIFNGVSQILDYILVEPELFALATDFGPLHVNTDFGAAPPGEADHPSPRASDHDPLILRIPLPGAPMHRIWLPLAIDDDDVGGDTVLPGVATATPDRAVPTEDSRPTATPPSSSGSAPRTPLRITELFYDGDVPMVESDEYVEFENVTDETIALAGWRLISVRGNDQEYAFPADARIEAGQRCRVYTDEDHDELPCAFRWGYTRSAVWRNAGDKAELRDASGALIDHACYGDHEGQCS